MNTLLQYKCPCCDGAIEFDTDAQKMKCPYCDTEFDIQTLQAYNQVLQTDATEQMQWQQQDHAGWQPEEAQNLCMYTCGSCGGQVVGELTTAATQCPYCGNPVIMTGQLTGQLKPDYVIPFKLDKQAAMDALKKHYEGKRLLPDSFRTQNHIQQIRGIYVPFWLFGARANAQMHYRATRVHCWSDSRYIYTKTKYYAVARAGTLDFSQVPVDGSSKMDDALMESLEPYDYREAVDFHTAYLAGFLADKYDVDSETTQARAAERIRCSTRDTFRSTVVGYDSVIAKAEGISLSDTSAKYALCPVWLLNTRWQDRDYIFAMNGQTGKMAGDLPMDKRKMWKWLLGMFAAVTAGVFALQYAIWYF